VRVDNSVDYKLIFSIKEHAHLGLIIEPHVVAYTPIHTLSLTYQRVFSGNADYYTKLSKEELEWIALLDPVMDEHIVRKFSPVKKIRPKEYFKKHFKSEVFKNRIRPYLEKSMAQLLKELPQNFDGLYIADEINPAAKQVRITTDPTRILFHFRRNENGTAYFITLKHNDEKVEFMKQYGLLLSNKPAFMVVNGVLYRFFDFVEGNKLAVFRNKKFIHVKPENEEKYYRTYIKTLLETSPVFAQGFEINTHQVNAIPALFLATNINNEFGLELKFKYGENYYSYDPKKQYHVEHLWDAQNPVFDRYRRSIEWENNKLEALKVLNLKESPYGLLIYKKGDLPNAVEWLQKNAELLNETGYEIHSTLQKDYSFSTPQINYRIAENLDWFDVNITISVEDYQISFKEIAKAIKRGETEMELPNGKIFLFKEAWFALSEALYATESTPNGYAIKKYQTDVLNHIESQNIKDHINKLTSYQEITEATSFNGTLRKYQREGLSWLYFLYANKFGGILADDMGLGKTIQTLAFLQYVKNQHQPTKPSLLVAPTSLLHNWKNEAKEFTPDLVLTLHAGSKRANQINQLIFGTHLVITSYGLIRNDFELFSEVEWDVIVLDESQNIKNHTSKTTQRLNKLVANCRIALTGTPIENSVKDLWSQMNFLNKGLLQSLKKFEAKYAKPIEKQGDKDKANELTELIKPFLLRRTKDAVAKELPPLTEKTIVCDMDAEQEKRYEEIKSEYRNALLNIVDEKEMNKSRMSMLQGLSKLRQLASHPKLIEPDYKGISGKHQMVLEHIETAVKEGHNVLVFSQFVKYLHILEEDLEERGIDFYTLIGSTSKEQRAARVASFQKGKKPVFLISLKAGGTGLNLTNADYVFIVDPWWNPAAEAQARDRTHRIGQVQNVFSYRFISANTVEEKIVQLQKRKKSFAEDVIEIQSNILSTLDAKDLRILLS
jgi:SNF2 family DNA or RNA helicase